MIGNHKIYLHFSLLNQFANAASKQFKMLFLINKNNPYSNLSQPIKFPNHQQCLEILSRGFGFSNYEKSRLAIKDNKLSPFEMPLGFIKKIHVRLNQHLENRIGYYYNGWESIVIAVFNNVFALEHTALQVYDQVKIAKFSNYSAISQVSPICKLINNFLFFHEDSLCEREDSLFLLNFFCLLIEDAKKKVQWETMSHQEQDEISIMFKVRDIFRKPFYSNENLEIAIDYLIKGLFDTDCANLIMQIKEEQNTLDSIYRITLTDRAYIAINFSIDLDIMGLHEKDETQTPNNQNADWLEN
jgi:hypothetical protein